MRQLPQSEMPPSRVSILGESLDNPLCLQPVMSGLVIDKQDESDKKGELYQMILDLKNEVDEIKKSKK